MKCWCLDEGGLCSGWWVSSYLFIPSPQKRQTLQRDSVREKPGRVGVLLRISRNNLQNSLYSPKLPGVTQGPDKVGHYVHKVSDNFFIFSVSTALSSVVNSLCFFASSTIMADNVPPPPLPLDAHLTTWNGVLVSVLPYSTLKTIAAAIGIPRPWPKGLITMRPRIMTALSAIVPRPVADPVTNLTAFVPPVIVPNDGNIVNNDGDNNNVHNAPAGNDQNVIGVPDALAQARKQLEDAEATIRAHQDRIAVLEQSRPALRLPASLPPSVLDIGQFIRDTDVFSDDPYVPHIAIYTLALRAFRAEASEYLRSSEKDTPPSWLRSREAFFSRLSTLHDTGVDCQCLSPAQSSAWKTLLNRTHFRLADGEYLPLRNELSAIVTILGWRLPNADASLLAAAILTESRQLGNAVKITHSRRLAHTPYDRPSSAITTDVRPVTSGNLKSSADTCSKPPIEQNTCGHCRKRGHYGKDCTIRCSRPSATSLVCARLHCSS
ncbi:hypothetical protein BC829DRAFT_418099 [Chytridium lagenaria]|nr:hypothetical protein BC829DRAFT_418099 [Chytridium lagenaria]